MRRDMKIRTQGKDAKGELHHIGHKELAVGIKTEKGICHLGLDSEGTGREKVNLLSSPFCISWEGCIMVQSVGGKAGKWICRSRFRKGLLWRVAGVDHMEWVMDIRDPAHKGLA